MNGFLFCFLSLPLPLHAASVLGASTVKRQTESVVAGWTRLWVNPPILSERRSSPARVCGGNLPQLPLQPCVAKVSLPGNKSMTHFDAVHLCQVNTGTPTRLFPGTSDSHTQLKRCWCSLIIPDLWAVFLLPSILLNTVSHSLNTCQPLPPVLIASSSLSFPTSLWIIELSLSRGPAPLIRCVGHQACFTAPSPVAEASPMLPSWHWGNHSHAPHLLLTSTLAPSQSFFKLSPS